MRRPTSRRGIAAAWSPTLGLTFALVRPRDVLPTEPGYQDSADRPYQLAEELAYQTQTQHSLPPVPPGEPGEPGEPESACPTCPTQPFAPKLTADTEHYAAPVPVQNNLLEEIEISTGAGVTLARCVNMRDQPLTILTTGWVLSKHDAAVFGHYLGWTLSGNDPPFRVETVEMEYAATRTWDTS